MQILLKRFIPFLTNTYIWVSAAAAALAYLAAGIQSLERVSSAALVFLLSISSYALIRVIKNTQRPFEGRSVEEAWHRSNAWVSALTFGLSAAAIAFCLFEFLLNGMLYGVIIPPLILTAAYSLPIRRFKKTPLREVPGVKILAIAWAWSWTATFVPILLSGRSVNTTSWLVFILIFLFVVAITIPFDIRDVDRDHSSMKTIPQVFGIARAKAIALFCMTAFLIGTVALQFHLHFEKGLLAGVFLGSFYGGFLISKSGDPERNHLYYSFWVESIPMAIWMGIWLYKAFI